MTVLDKIETNGWTVELQERSPASAVFGMRYEVIIRRPDGTWVVCSRDVDAKASCEDMMAAAFAIAAVLDPEHNGPWQEDER